jgi:DNA-binding transcriptional LysR family regulator
MDLKQLSALLAVADHGSFSAAAKALFTVQSNVSAHVQRLETELGAVLIDRARGQLTAAGQLVAVRARRIQAELDAMPTDLSASIGRLTGEVRFGVIGTTARWLMPQFLNQLRESHPGVRVVVMEASTTSLVPQVEDGRLELAVVNLPIDSPELLSLPLFDEDLVCIVGTNHDLADNATVTVAQLAHYDLMLPPTGTALRRDLEDQARKAHVALKVMAEIDGGRLMTSLAMEGYAAAVVPATAAPRWVKGDFTVIPMVGLPRRRVGLAQRRRTTLSAAGQAVVNVLTDVMRERGSLQPGVFITA